MNKSTEGTKRFALPCGFLGMLLLAICVEYCIRRHDSRLVMDPTIHQWRFIGRHVAEEAPKSEILCFGDSLVNVGVSPKVIERRLGKRTYNFAVGGGQAASSYFLLRQALASGSKPSAVLVDFKWSNIIRPYSESTYYLPVVTEPRDMLELALVSGNWTFCAHVAVMKYLPSVRNRYVLRDDLRKVLGGGTPPKRDQIAEWRANWAMNNGATHVAPDPKWPGKLDTSNKYTFPEKLEADPVNLTFLNRFLELASAHEIPVFWLLMPSAPAAQTWLVDKGIDAEFTQFVHDISDKYAYITIVDGRYAKYEDSVFIDATHFNERGTILFSDDAARIVENRLATPSTASTWMSLPRFHSIANGLDVENVAETSLRLIERFNQNVRR